MQKGIIDRFEGNYAIIEIDGKNREFPVNDLPVGAKEGDIVSIKGDSIIIDQNETGKLHKKIKSLMDDVWED